MLYKDSIRACPYCGLIFSSWFGTKSSGVEYCSRVCVKLWKREHPTAADIASDTDRFWSHVEKRSDCWRWTGATLANGYGVTRWGGKQWTTHRLSWTLHHGEIPDGMNICHRCDVRDCVNPDHLFLGTHTDNSTDRNAKGRHAHGEKHGRAKLTAEDVRTIRRLHAEGMQRRDIAKRYPFMHPDAISHIAHGRSWKHV